ncbi:MAG: hypothetical protein AAFU79_13185 [Myxococcota bacterium]
MESLSSFGVFLLAAGVFLVMAAWRLGTAGALALFLVGLLLTTLGAALVHGFDVPARWARTQRVDELRPSIPGLPRSVLRCEWRGCARLR